MIVDLIVTVIIIVAGCFLLLQLYDIFSNEIIRTLIVIGYGLFVIGMLLHWLFSNLHNII